MRTTVKMRLKYLYLKCICNIIDTLHFYILYLTDGKRRVPRTNLGKKFEMQYIALVVRLSKCLRRYVGSLMKTKLTK